jgi:predicted metal-dependent hydrolase
MLQLETLSSSLDCESPLHLAAIEGLRLFNQGQYWHAHEALEIAWREEPGFGRELYRGILQAGVVYLHLQRGNYAGAIKVFERSLRWLRLFPDFCRGIAIGQLRHDLGQVMAEVTRLGPERLSELNHSLFKPVLFWG